MCLWIPGRDGTRCKATENFLVNVLHAFHRFNRRYHVKKKKHTTYPNKWKAKSIYLSCRYQKQLNSIGKDPNYDLITPNGIIRHFSIYRSRGVRKLVIPVGITRSERVNATFTRAIQLSLSLTNHHIDTYSFSSQNKIKN